MPRPAAPFPPRWTARPLAGSAAFLPAVSLSDLGPDWKDLGQAWLPARESGFNRGWARIRWNADGLLFETLFTQTRPSNRARRLNDRTWELGDVGEFFLQERQTGRYLELHVTPENQRLQCSGRPEASKNFAPARRPWPTSLSLTRIGSKAQRASSRTTGRPGPSCHLPAWAWRSRQPLPS